MDETFTQRPPAAGRRVTRRNSGAWRRATHDGAGGRTPMVTFLDGPAVLVTLALRQAPLFLRVTRRPGRRRSDGEWDALDLVGDRPAADEFLYAYRRVRERGSVHACVRGKGRGGSGCYAVADYAVVDPQPADAILRDEARWQEWRVEQAKGLAPKE